ncbi:MAG: hypothetical protein KDK90_12695 [Leptospiraceae bacterium]|nr:hypothetical protein [Leptospiraceae bacterium]
MSSIFSFKKLLLFILLILCCEYCISFFFPPKKLPIEIPLKKSSPIKTPIFRLNNKMHGMSITGVATDASNKILATVSLDKTVRIWDLITGELLKIIRIPIGKAKEGELYTVAISPNQQILACAGWTGYEWDGTFSVYFINLHSDKIAHLVSGLPAAITKIVFSKDGQYLAATLKDGYGIRVYNTYDYSLVAIDDGYNKDCYGVDFDLENRIVTASYDGFIRLYDKEFKLIAKEKAFSELPHSVSFSPDGKKIAVGYKESIRVDILAGHRIFIIRSYLSNLYPLETQGIENGDLSIVHFSKDGKYIYAGGNWQKNSYRYLRRWENKESGSYTNIKTKVTDSISQIINTYNDAIIIASSTPSFQIIGKSKKVGIFKNSIILPNKHLQDNLMISRDGYAVRVWYDKTIKAPLVFSLYDKKLVWDKDAYYKLYSPGIITSQKNFTISNWNDGKVPVLNNKEIILEKGDFSRSISISLDEKLALLGTDNYLYLFDKHVKELWKIPIPASTYSVNISMDKNVVVAALEDGTIRWYRLEDGSELVALLVLKDFRGWVLFSPSGYYDTNDEKAEELLGWVINTGRTNSSYFVPSFILNRYLNSSQVISYIIDHNKTDKEAIFSLDEDFVDVSKLIPELFESIRLGEDAFRDIDDSKEEKPVARVFSTDLTTGNVIIVSAYQDQPFLIGQKLYVMNIESKIYMEVVYSSGKVTKCKLVERNGDITKVRLNTIVLMGK